MKINKIKGLNKWFDHIWFFNHSLKWFLVILYKNAFVKIALMKNQKNKIKSKEDVLLPIQVMVEWLGIEMDEV